MKFSFFKASGPSAGKVPSDRVDRRYSVLRRRTFWGVTLSYSLFYVCRMTLSVVKQPVVDEGIVSVSTLGLMGSVMLFAYAAGKFINSFLADYCNIRRFMAVGLSVSAAINMAIGLLSGAVSTEGSASLALLAVSVLWALNGVAQSMGAGPAVISFSRWYPKKTRGTFYSIFCATPYLGKSLSFLLLGAVVTAFGWRSGFYAAAVAGVIGAALAIILISDSPESRGLPCIQELGGEPLTPSDRSSTLQQQLEVIRNPGIWIVALSSAFVYMTQYAVSGWGILFLQKAKSFDLGASTSIIAMCEFLGIIGAVGAGWISDRLFRGDRAKPVLLSGILCLVSLSLFLFTGGSYLYNAVCISVFSLSIGVMYCIVAGIMAMDMVPRKATGAAVGIVGVFSYIAAGIQDLISGILIQENSADLYNFAPVSAFWLVSCLLAFAIPAVAWNRLKTKR